MRYQTSCDFLPTRPSPPCRAARIFSAGLRHSAPVRKLDNLSRCARMEPLLETTMRTLTIGEFKAQFSDVLTAVQAGESVIVCYGRKKRRVAALVPYAEFAAGSGKRPLGLLKGKGGFTLAEDFALSDDEFLAA